MLSKLQASLVSLMFLFVGLLIGWFLWSNQPKTIETHDMFGMMIDMTNDLKGRTGDDFDVVFLNQMIVHHQGAVDMANLALNNAKHPEIVELSKNIIEAQNREISDMKTWMKTWYDL
ncbi:MAG: DUF305 domain-containing protein [Minisyncoccia bacterium]